jgi:hypothetical protein
VPRHRRPEAPGKSSHPRRRSPCCEGAGAFRCTADRNQQAAGARLPAHALWAPAAPAPYSRGCYCCGANCVCAAGPPDTARGVSRAQKCVGRQTCTVPHARHTATAATNRKVFALHEATAASACRKAPIPLLRQPIAPKSPAVGLDPISSHPIPTRLTPFTRPTDHLLCQQPQTLGSLSVGGTVHSGMSPPPPLIAGSSS